MSEFERFLNNVQALLAADAGESASGAGSTGETAVAATAESPQDSSSSPCRPVARDGAKRPADAIEEELARPARTTEIVSLRDSPEVEAFRNELIDGLIRVDTANQLLRLLNTIISRMLV
jgi:hypothetical protein